MVPRALYSPFPAPIPSPMPCILHSHTQQVTLQCTLTIHTSLYFSFFKDCFFFLSRWSILTPSLKAHKTHKISTNPSLHSLVSSSDFCLSTSRRSAQGHIALVILLAAYVVSSFHTCSLQLILSTVTVAIHLKGMSDLVSLQLKALY